MYVCQCELVRMRKTRGGVKPKKKNRRETGKKDRNTANTVRVEREKDKERDRGDKKNFEKE